MPIYKNKYLQGLRGFSDLSAEERAAYKQHVFDENPGKEEQINNLSIRDWEDLYRAKQFKDTFKDNLDADGRTFNDYTPEERDSYYTKYIVDKAIDDQFGAYPEELEKIRNSELSTEGLIELLESGYVPNKAIEDTYKSSGINDWLGRNLNKALDWTSSYLDREREAIEQSKEDDAGNLPALMLDYIAGGANRLTKAGVGMIEGPIKAGLQSSEEKAKTKNEAIYNDIVSKDVTKTLERIGETGYPKAIQDKVWEVYNNAEEEGRDPLEELKDWYGNLTSYSYVDDQGRHLYKNNSGQFVYTNYLGEEVLAPEEVPMSEIEVAEYQKLEKEGKTEIDDGVRQDEDGNWFRKVRRFEDSGNGAFQVFKDRKQFDENHVTPEQMVSLITDFITLENFAGRSKALQKSSIDIQKHIDDNQFKLNTDIAQVYSRFVGGLVNTLWMPIRTRQIESEYGKEGLANVLAGLNPDGSEIDNYDMANPYYWSMVETSGSVMPGVVNDYIKYGYSPYQSIYDPTKSEWGVRRTLSDAAPMMGYGLEQAAIAAALGGITKGVSGAVRGAGRLGVRGAGNTANTTVRNAAVGNYKFTKGLGNAIEKSQMFTVPTINSLGIAQGYGTEAFKNVYEQGLDQIENLKREDGLAYVQSLMNTDEYKNAVEEEFNRIYKGYSPEQRKEFRSITNDDGTTSMVNPELYAKRQAEMKVRNDMLQYYLNTPELQREHNGVTYDEMAERLKSDALTAYKTDFAIEAISQSFNFALFRTFLMTPSQRAMFNSKPLPMKFTEGGRKAAVDASAKMKLKEWGKGVGKAVGGGTLSNYNDEIRRDWAQAYGIYDFNNYMGYITDPDNYLDQEPLHSGFWQRVMYANEVAGETALKESSLRAGFVGGVGSIFGGGLNIGGIAKTLKNGRRVSSQELLANKEALERGELNKIKTGWNTNNVGTKLSGFDAAMNLAANIVSSPVTASYQDVLNRVDLTQNIADSYNKFVEEHGDKIVDITNLIETATRAYNMSVNGRGHYLHTTSDDEHKNRPISFTGAYIDNDALAAFEIIRRLNEYGENKNFIGSDYLRQAYNTMQDALKGNRISDELINDFLGDRQNKKDTQGMSEEEKRSYAESVLKDRIKEMKKVADAYNKARIEWSQSSFFTENNSDALNQVLYMSVMQDRWQRGLDKMNSEIGNGNEHNPFYYGNKDNYSAMKTAQQKTVNGIKATIDVIDKDIREARIRKDKKKRTVNQLYKALMLKHLEIEQEKLNQMERDNVWDMGLNEERKAPVLSANEIMNLNPTERAYMLDENNKSLYSKEQQAIIDDLKASMIDDSGTNNATMDKVMDTKTLSERIQLNALTLDQAKAFPTLFIDLTNDTRAVYASNLANAYINKEAENLFTTIENINDSNYNAKLRAFKDSGYSTYVLRRTAAMFPDRSAESIIFNALLKEKQLEEDYMDVLDKYSAPIETKEALRRILYNTTKDSYTESDAMGALELYYSDAAENPDMQYNMRMEDANGEMASYNFTGADIATHMNNILTNLEKINHMRNSAVVYNARIERKEQARIAEERRVAAQKELALQKARVERAKKEKEAIELRKERLKQTAEREYADSRERMIEPTNAKDYAHFKEQAKTLAKHYVSQMLNGKSLRALKSSIAKDNIDTSGLIEVIQKYRNAEKLYGYLWNKSTNRTVAAIESALHEAGYTWESIEGKVIDESTQKDIIINNTRHDDSLPKGATIAENATPYIYKDGVLISKPRTDVVIGMKEMSDEELAPRKEWRRKRVGFRQYENELVEVEYKPYIKKKFSTVVRKTKKDRILDYIRVNGLDSGLSTNSKKVNILIQIANGTKFKWVGEDVNRGIGKEMGQIDSESERKAYESIIDETNGITPTELYEALNADLEDYLADSDDKYTLDDVMDVISEINSPYKAWQELENIVSESMSTEEKQAEAVREAQRQAERQAYAEARGFESWEALMNETDKEAEILENELREEYNAYMESQDRQEVEDEERLKEAEQHEKSFEGELNEWKEAINQLYFDEEETTINEENETEETTTQLEGQPTTDEGRVTEGSEILQGQQPTVTSGVEGTQSNQIDIESQSTDGIPSESQPTVRPRGVSTVQQKLPSEKTAEEEVADELIENPDEDINVIKISDIPPTIDRSTERVDRLWGNAMYRFDKAKLENQGIYDTIQPEEAKAKRALQQFLDDNNIHLQDIIDFELGQILNAYPNMKIRFMKTKGSNNVYNVIEYTDGVARLHDNDRGGIIESNGKKWLIVGVLGYMFAGRNASEQVRRISTQQAQHFNPISQQLDSEMQSSKEKFYVSESMYTKVLEQSNGYVTNRTSENEKIVSRSLKDMLADKDANPHKLQFGTLKFGVQKGDNFIVYNIGNERFFPPKDKIKKGSSYVLVPAANGSYVPMYINAVTYNQINDGRLKSTIDSLLMRFADRVATPTIEAARLVQRELEQYIAFGNNTTGVKLALHDDGTVQILVNGVPIDTTTLGNINAAFLNTLKKQNLRINVGKEVFTRRATFDMYAEAGALDIDSQILGFRGSMYNVSPINTNGTPMVTTRIYEGVMGQQSVGDASTKRTAGTARYGNLAYHRLTSNPDVWLSSDGVEVTDYELLEKLKYAEFIGMHKNNPNYTAVSKNTKRVTQYYIYDDGNKLGLRYDVYSDTLEIMTPNEYDRMILAIKDEVQKKAATEALRQSKPAEASLWEESPTEPAKQPTEEEAKKEETQKPVSPIKTPSPETRNLQVPKISGTFALEDIIRGRAGKEAQNTIREALKEVVKKFNITKPSLPNILRTIESKGVSTTNITNLEDWIDNVLNCH